MQQQLWFGAAGAAAIAVVSALGEHRRRRRRRIDDVGYVPWQFLQVMAMLGAVILASVALNLR
ncbi:MAG: hypothetical protein IIZ38_20345 [Sphingomonas sp.]|uniref:hypothetical protein n=1 Tax=unclassified Sphingomonas TaxID=196159 RepID=UPI00245523C6|nr:MULTISPECIES: hypothetical protein [unclassified Sphingomonas]MBQ1500666.1 hypothetical protein [Sphingomonas sp.]MDH4744770.1 hypothetical protein [Sphingomonas sp. CBMAI 2297]